jgi:hypothetical protein
MENLRNVFQDLSADRIHSIELSGHVSSISLVPLEKAGPTDVTQKPALFLMHYLGNTAIFNSTYTKGSRLKFHVHLCILNEGMNIRKNTLLFHLNLSIPFF